MPEYKLTYFDFDGGRGEPIRIALHAAGIEFEDERLAFSDFSAAQPGFRFYAVPVLTVDGAQITQSNAIGRYIGKMAGLYPSDDLQALYCDEVVEALEDLTNHIVQTFFLEGDALKQAREKLVEGRMTTYLKGLEELLTRGGGEYFAAGQLTMADIKAFVQMRALRAGVLDHVPTDIVERLAPGMAAHSDRVAADSRVVSYYESRA